MKKLKVSTVYQYGNNEKVYWMPFENLLPRKIPELKYLFFITRKRLCVKDLSVHAKEILGSFYFQCVEE